MKKIISLLLILFFLVGCTSENKEEVVVEKQEEVIEEKEPETIITKTRLIMGGDGLTHESVYLDNKTEDGYDFTYPFSEIKKLIKDYDLAYYNQETVLGGKEYEISGYPVFNTPQEVGDSLLDAGFNLVSLSTNHLLDYYNTLGNKLILSQRNYFLNKENVIAAGSYINQSDKDNLQIGEVNGLTYGLLSYTYGSNFKGPKEDEPYLINYIDKENIKNDVLKYRDKVDLLLVAMHWGEENSTEENNYQRQYAEYLADLGVDIVIGTHPHVLQPIEWIDNTLVFYSLGNMFSNQYFNIDNLSSCLASVDIIKTKTGDDVKIEIGNIECNMIFTVLEDRHKVFLYKDLTEDQLANKDAYFSKYKDILTKYEKNIEVK